MQLEVLLFAAARDAAGSDKIRLELPDRAKASDVMEAIGQQLPKLKGLLPSCRLAIDCSYVAGDCEVSANADEIALIPPVSGG